MSHLSISLLGGFEVVLDGEPVTTFGTDKTRALLAYLAVEADRPHRRAALAGLLWPELPEPKAALSLRQSLLRLRRAVGEGDARPDSSLRPFLLVSGQDVQFNPLSNHRLDVAEFQELLRASRQHSHVRAETCSICIGWLRQAADLYRGDLLSGFSPRDSVPFEEWQLVQQEALHRQAIEVLTRLAEAYESRGEPAQVLEYALRLVALEPWQERAQMQLMGALAQSGQLAAGLEQYEKYSRMLAREFGVSPSAEVTALYHRIREDHAGGGSGAAGPSGQPEAATRTPAIQDERRQVTALVCHWGIPASDDPEEMEEGLVRFDRVLAEIAERHGGQLDPRRGSEFLVYFGHPVAQEDASHRAVSAALALAASPGNREHVRVGIHTGLMVSHGRELVGTVPDLARDCLRLAEPGGVVISADTEHLVRGWFTCQPMSAPGSAQKAPVYRVPAESTGHAHPGWYAQSRQPARLIGRQDELGQLAACLERVRTGQGQIVIVCGEPGIGKTRLTRAFKQMCPWPATWVESHCSPLFQNTSLYPIRNLLEQLLEFEPGDDAAVKREKLAGALARLDLTSPTTLWLISLSLGLPTDTPAPRIITEELRERMREAYLALLQRESARQPVMLFIEDLQWADPTTIAWLGRSMDALAAVPCVVWLNWRPEFIAPWLRRPHMLSINLGPLSPRQSADLVSAVVGEEVLPDEMCQQIVKQADGIPLYVEELTHTLLARRASENAAGQQALPIPATLRDSLTARLDRTGAARETAQFAAALGREFEYPILRAVVPFGEARLQSDLAVLVEFGLVTAGPETAHYAFRHALIRDAAYGLLLRRTRRDIHRRIAEALAANFPRVAETQPEVLAQHYSEAGLAVRAAEHWIRAGEHAAAEGATLEARAFFDRALTGIETADYEWRWRALVGREAVLNLREERAAQRADIEALLNVAEFLDDDTRRAQALLRQATYAYRLDDFQLMLHASEAAAVAAARRENRERGVQALSTKLIALSRLGRWEAAHSLVEEIQDRWPGITDDAVQDSALSAMALYYSDVGDVARALLLRRQGIELARRTGDRDSESRHLTNAGFHYAQLGLYVDARAAYERALALAEAMGNRFLQTNLKFDLCYALWCAGDRDGAQAVGERALLELRIGNYRAMATATCLAYLGMVLEDAADYVVAAAHLAESRALFVNVGLDTLATEVQAVEARCLLALGRREEAWQLAAGTWAYLRARGTVLIDFPSRVFTCIADVVAAVEPQGVSAREVLEAGYRELMGRAEMISDPHWRRSFLEDELTNRALLARWTRLHEGVLPIPDGEYQHA